MHLFLRISSYGIVFLAYLIFMSIYAPLGINWMDFHAIRIFNAVEFLREFGQDSFGYTVWSVCKDCILESNVSETAVLYGNMHGINLFPYFIMNYIGGKDFLFFAGPLFDKFIIFVCAAIVSELMIKSLTDKTTQLPIYLVGMGCFALFSLSPWAYKIFLGGWWEPYFLMFFLLGIYLFIYKKFIFGYLSFFLASLSSIQWGFVVTFFYSLLIITQYIFANSNNALRYFPPNIVNKNQSFKLIISLALPIIFLSSFKIIASQFIEFSPMTSSVFYRMGISGNDIHNGGLIGALQFLGGSRITQCFQGFSSMSLPNDTMTIIAIYNCIFSIVGMAIISMLSIFGLYLLIKDSFLAQKVFLPLIFSLIFFIGIFQQSLSVHLMGYSFIFSALFSVGITFIMLRLQNFFGSPSLGLIFSIPCLSGILILSIRASMLSGMA
jgi:hypothetical protein